MAEVSALATSRRAPQHGEAVRTGDFLEKVSVKVLVGYAVCGRHQEVLRYRPRTFDGKRLSKMDVLDFAI